MCCSVLPCVAVCCRVLQCVAVWCEVCLSVYIIRGVYKCVAVCCSVLPCVAVCCKVLRGVLKCIYNCHVTAFRASNY